MQPPTKLHLIFKLIKVHANVVAAYFYCQASGGRGRNIPGVLGIEAMNT